jgi:large subunit ribosomal protein L7/L12
MPQWLLLTITFVLGMIAGAMLRGRRDETPPAPPRFPPGSLPDLEEEVRRLMAERKKIEAIKLYRETTGVGLKEAKEAVEALDRA